MRLIVILCVGDVVYFNKDLRKTVRHLPGVSSRILSDANRIPREEASEDSSAATVSHHESTGNEVFVPINFDTAMSIEGHESQVVHVSPNHFLLKLCITDTEYVAWIS